LSVADQYDVQVAIHTDTLNEAGFVEATIAAFKNRVIHIILKALAAVTHRTSLKVCGESNVLPSSTEPDTPHT